MPDITFAIRAITSFQGGGFSQLSGGLRDLRLQFLGFEQVALVLNRVGEAFTRLGGAPFAALASTVGVAAKFNDAITQISLVSPELSSQIDQLSDDFLRISGALPLSAQQLALVGVEASRAGINTREGINALALLSGKLAAISADLSEAQAAKALAALTTQFRDTSKTFVEQSTEIADALAKLRLEGLGTAGELVNITKRFGFLAREMGFTAAQAIAFAAVFRKAGVQVEVAGTAMSKLLGRMAAQSEKFASAAGINAKELENLIDSGQGLTALLKFMTGLNEEAGGSFVELQKRIKSMGLRGERIQPVLIALAKRQDLVTAALKASSETTGELDRQFAVFSKSLGKRIDTLVGSFENLKIAIGRVLEPILVPFISAFTFLVNVLVAIPAPVKLLIILLVSLAAALLFVIGAMFLAVAAFVTATVSIIFLILSLTTMIRSLRKSKFAMLRYMVTVSRFTGVNLRAAFSTGILNASLRSTVPAVRGAARALARFILMAGPSGAGGGALGLGVSLTTVALIFAAVVAVVIAVIVILIALRKEIEDVFKAFFEILKPIGTLIEGLADIAGAADPNKKGSAGAAFFALVRFGAFPLIFALKALAFRFRVVAAIMKAVVGAILSGLEPLKATFERIVFAVDNLREAFKNTLIELGLMTEKASVLETVFKILGNIFRVSFFGLFLLFRAIALNIGFIVAVVVGVIEGIERAIGPLFELLIEMKTLITEAFDDISKILEPAIKAFKELISIFSEGEEGLDLFGIVVQAVAAVVRIALFPTILALKLLLGFLRGVIKGVIFQVKLLVKWYTFLLGPLIKAAQALSKFLKVSEEGGSILSFFSDSIKKLFEDFGKDPLSTFFGVFVKAFDVLPEKVRAAFRKIKVAVVDLFEVLTGGLLSPIASFEQFRTAIVRLVDAVKELIGLLIPSNLGKRFGKFGNIIKPFQEGGIVGSTGLAILHKGEMVIPSSSVGSSVAAERIPFARAAAGAVGGEGAPTSLEIVIPVSVRLDDIELGRTVVRITEEEIRRQFGTRGIRLAGVG